MIKFRFLSAILLVVFLSLQFQLTAYSAVEEGPMEDFTDLLEIQYGTESLSELFLSDPEAFSKLICRSNGAIFNFPPKPGEMTIVRYRYTWFFPKDIVNMTTKLGKTVYVGKDTVCFDDSNMDIFWRWSRNYPFIDRALKYPVYNGDYIYYVNFNNSIVYSRWSSDPSNICKAGSVGNYRTGDFYVNAVFSANDIINGLITYTSYDLECSPNYNKAKIWIKRGWKQVKFKN